MIYHIAVAQTAAGTIELVAAPSEFQNIRVLNYALILDSPGGTFAFQDGTDWLSGDMSVGANGGASAKGTVDEPLMKTARGRPLQLTTTGAPANGHVTALVA